MFVKVMEKYVLPTIAKCATTIASFNLWMSRFGCHNFALVINFIDDPWVPYHVTIALFEAQGTSNVVLTIQVESFLIEVNLTNKIITYIKDEGGSLNTLAIVLTSIVQIAIHCNLTCLTLGHVLNMLRQRHVNMPLTMTKLVMGCTILV
jgi:hypothetical protein